MLYIHPNLSGTVAIVSYLTFLKVFCLLMAVRRIAACSTVVVTISIFLTIGHGTIKTSSYTSLSTTSSTTASTSSTSSHPSVMLLLVLLLVLLIVWWRLIRRGRGWRRISCRRIYWRRDRDIVIRQMALHMVRYGLHLMHLIDELMD